MKAEHVKYAIIGSGWRAQFYIRIAQALPALFSVSGVMIRDPEKGRAFSEAFHVKVVNHIEDLMKDEPEFVVLSVKRGVQADMLRTLTERGIPVLCETPPGEDEEQLETLYTVCNKKEVRVQVAEQYFLQPLYVAWEKAIRDGLIGEVQNINISSLHGYHGVSMIRRYLQTGFQNCTIYGKRYRFDVTDTFGRAGMVFDGDVFSCTRDRVTLEFEDGKVAFFDFSDPAQYHSFIRTRQLTVQGVRGEIDDLTIRYLTEKNIPVTQELQRVELGKYHNEGFSLYAIMLGERFLYRSPFEDARLNDDELAVAECLQRMKHYLRTGEAFYSLSEATQDMYIALKMEEAMKTPYQPVTTKTGIWAN